MANVNYEQWAQLTDLIQRVLPDLDAGEAQAEANNLLYTYHLNKALSDAATDGTLTNDGQYHGTDWTKPVTIGRIMPTQPDSVGLVAPGMPGIDIFNNNTWYSRLHKCMEVLRAGQYRQATITLLNGQKIHGKVMNLANSDYFGWYPDDHEYYPPTFADFA